MRVPVRFIALIFILGINLPACHSGDGGSTGTKNQSLQKGDTHTMKTYYMGRFSLNIPVQMKPAVQAHTVRLLEIEESGWETGTNASTRSGDKWHEHLSKLESLTKPKNVKKIVIKEEELSEVGQWARAVLYYGDYMANDEASWDIFVNYGDFHALFSLTGLLDAEGKMLSWMKEVIRAYNPKPNQPKVGELFYTARGQIALPYKRQEKTYARFEDHAEDLKLEVEMNETHEVEKMGVAERLAASLATRFAPGVNVDKLRSLKRVAAGLNGEEMVMRMSASGEDTQIQFGWEYRGKADSGEHPEIQITMETSDGNLDEKLKIWDAIIDSFKPMYR